MAFLFCSLLLSLSETTCRLFLYCARCYLLAEKHFAFFSIIVFSISSSLGNLLQRPLLLCSPYPSVSETNCNQFHYCALHFLVYRNILQPFPLLCSPFHSLAETSCSLFHYCAIHFLLSQKPLAASSIIMLSISFSHKNLLQAFPLLCSPFPSLTACFLLVLSISFSLKYQLQHVPLLFCLFPSQKTLVACSDIVFCISFSLMNHFQTVALLCSTFSSILEINCNLFYYCALHFFVSQKPLTACSFIVLSNDFSPSNTPLHPVPLSSCKLPSHNPCTLNLY